MSGEFWLLAALAVIVIGATLFCWTIIYAVLRFMKIGEKGEFDDE